MFTWTWRRLRKNRQKRKTGKVWNRSGGRGTQKTIPSFSKFKGNCVKLEGYVFDCADYRQADKYVTNMKRIDKHIGAEYKQGGNMHSTVENEVPQQIPIPPAPTPIVTEEELTKQPRH
jgi:hypothetical protein